MEKFVQLIESGAVAVAAVLLLAAIGSRFERYSFWRGILSGIVFSAAGLVAMASPVEIAPGFIVDARNVVNAWSGAFGGPIAAVMTGSALVMMRLHIGGGGMAPGISVILTVSAASILFWWVTRRYKIDWLALKPILVLALLAALGPAVGVFFVRNAIANMSTVLNVISYSSLTNFFGVFVMGLTLLGDHQRRWAMTAFRESEARLQAVADNAPGVLFQVELSPEKRIRFRYVSGGAARFFGTPSDDFVGDVDLLTSITDKGTLKKFRDAMTLSAQTMAPWTLEAPFTRPDGSTVWMRTAAEPHKGEGGTILWDGSVFDVTAQKQSEQRKDDFIATVSHELRTPLTSIRGSLGLVAKGAAGVVPVKAASLIKIAHANSERLVVLINDILDVQKMTSGQTPYNPSLKQIRPIVDQTIEANHGYFSEYGVTAVLIDRAPGISAVVDGELLFQAISNLLSNATKYSPKGEVVTVTIDEESGRVRISVADRGPGISTEFQNRIFGRFEQADSSSSRQKSGTGLGLSIVKAAIEKLGGTVDYQTKIGEGTTFQLELPVAPPPENLSDIKQGESP